MKSVNAIKQWIVGAFNRSLAYRQSQNPCDIICHSKVGRIHGGKHGKYRSK